ncbi:hypothetical protein [Spirosoma litoris]
MKLLSTLTYTLATGLMVSILNSCSPALTSAYRLEPVSGDVAQIDGRPVTKAEQNGVGVVASYEHEDLEFITLDIEIKNRTDHPIDVNPADFHFVALGAEQDTLSDLQHPNTILARSAADPAYEASRMTIKRKEEEKRLKRAKVFNTILMVAAIASDVSSSNNSRSYREYTNNRVVHGLAYQGIAVKRAIDYSTFANRMQRYDYEEYRWRELALKATTVAPGESVRGLVYFPKVQSAKYLAINYSLPEQANVPLLFKQELVQQKNSRKRR